MCLCLLWIQTSSVIFIRWGEMMFDLAGFAAVFLSQWTAHGYKGWSFCPHASLCYSAVFPLVSASLGIHPIKRAPLCVCSALSEIGKHTHVVCMLKKFKYLKGLFGTYAEGCLNKSVMRVKDMFMGMREENSPRLMWKLFLEVRGP